MFKEPSVNPIRVPGKGTWNGQCRPRTALDPAAVMDDEHLAAHLESPHRKLRPCVRFRDRRNVFPDIAAKLRCAGLRSVGLTRRTRPTRAKWARSDADVGLPNLCGDLPAVWPRITQAFVLRYSRRLAERTDRRVKPASSGYCSSSSSKSSPSSSRSTSSS